MSAATLSPLLLTELEAELKKTRRILDALPDGEAEFQPHEKSRPLAKLSGHVAELPSFITIILTRHALDMMAPGNPRKPIVVESKAEMLARFDENAASAIAALTNISDENLLEDWALSRGELKLFSGKRYDAYRSFGLNHLIHHRAQLGCYIRDLNLPLPGTYGPSADGM